MRRIVRHISWHPWAHMCGTSVLNLLRGIFEKACEVSGKRFATSEGIKPPTSATFANPLANSMRSLGVKLFQESWKNVVQALVVVGGQYPWKVAIVWAMLCKFLGALLGANLRGESLNKYWGSIVKRCV